MAAVHPWMNGSLSVQMLEKNGGFVQEPLSAPTGSIF
jgi:hypothetical protein